MTINHAFLTWRMLDRIGVQTADIQAVCTRIEVVITPFTHRVSQPDEMTGVGVIAAQELVAELG